MIIPIDETYRIASDSSQWMVQERKVSTSKKTGETTERWVAVLYYSNLENVIQGLFNLRLKISDAEGLVEATDYAKSLCNELSRALAPVIKVDMRLVK